jgi:dihydrofolate reductase
MRKIILFNLVSLDGYFAGPKGEIDWHNVDDEFNRFAIQQLDEVGALLFGRITYELMASYWPTPEAVADDPQVANKMNQLPKVVFSRTLNKAEWENSQLVKLGEGSTDLASEVAKLKQQPGKDLFVFGSSNLAAALIQNDLIDEYRVMVNPVVLGDGIPLFQGIQKPMRLKLQKSKIFANGNVLLYYQPEELST